MERQELIKNEGYWTAQLQITLLDTLENYLKENKMTQSQFAKKMNVSKGYVSQILNGNFDHKISKYIELLMACGKVPVLKTQDINDYIKADAAKNAKNGLEVRTVMEQSTKRKLKRA